MSEDLSDHLELSIESTANTGKCRICWRTSYLSELISPCVCSGSQEYTHFECLERWIQERDSTTKDVCDVCQQKYKQIVVKQYERNFGEWMSEGEDVFSKIFSTFIFLCFFFYLINMGCIQFVISENKINALIRYIQLVLIIFFGILFTIISLVAVYVCRAEFKEWQSSHMKTTVEFVDDSSGRLSIASSIDSNQSETSTNRCNTGDEQNTPLIINDSTLHYGSV